MSELQAVTAKSVPVAQEERIGSIDVLRGFAVLGILVMNIQSFSMIGSAYINPTAYGDLTGVNYAVWLASHLLADMKFMSIFSMLFGAGVIIMTSRREEVTGRSAGIHYRRMGWLLLFGILHGYLLWYGDILYAYALCGMLVYLFRKRSPRLLIVAGMVMLVIGSALSIGSHLSMPYWPAEAVAELQEDWQPPADRVQDEVNTYRGSWAGQMAHRAQSTFFFQTFLFAIEFLWRAGGLMLVGMGLHKLGVFGAKLGSGIYVGMIVAGALVGLPIVYVGVLRNEAYNWSLQETFFLGMQFNYWGSLLVSIGWVGLIMLLCKRGIAPRLTRPLAAVGQMAFTNYILQTVLCTLIFYGHGLGLFGKVERVGQIVIVLAIFVFQFVASPMWLQRFRFGPLEWLWRTLTYWKLQPMRRL